MRTSVKDGRKKMRKRERELKAIQKNTKEFESYTAKTWLADNEMFVRYSVNKLLEYYKFRRFKEYRLDIQAEAFIVCLQRFDKYKPGLRAVRPWLYTQIHFYMRKYITRKLERYDNTFVCYPKADDLHGNYALDPADAYEMKEDLALLQTKN